MSHLKMKLLALFAIAAQTVTAVWPQSQIIFPVSGGGGFYYEVPVTFNWRAGLGEPNGKLNYTLSFSRDYTPVENGFGATASLTIGPQTQYPPVTSITYGIPEGQSSFFLQFDIAPLLYISTSTTLSLPASPVWLISAEMRGNRILKDLVITFIPQNEQALYVIYRDDGR